MTGLAVVTGIGGGIGSAIGAAFRQAKWRVLGVELSGTAAGAAVADLLLEGDVAEEATWVRVREAVEAEGGGLDALVNNAAIQVARPLTETTVEEWDRVQAVNVRSVFLGLRHLHDPLAKQRGTVVNVSSVHALATSPRLGAYAASKGALAALTRSMALELAPRGVRVNAVLPGAVDTPMLEAGLERSSPGGTAAREEARWRLAERVALGRVGRPEEIAALVFFLADSERASYITGSLYTIDGGVLARLSSE